MYKRILFPTDGSELSEKAMATALALAKLAGARLQILAVKEPFPYSAISESFPVAPQEFLDSQDRIAQDRVKKVAAQAKAAAVECETVVVEAVHAWEGIIDQTKAGDCDLIVMASHGRRGISALLLGSETQKVLTHTKLPVLVVR